MSDETEDAIRRKGRSQTEGLGLFAKPAPVRQPRAIDYAVGRAHDARGVALMLAVAEMYGVDLLPTPRTEMNPVDGFFLQAGREVAVVEAKTRVTHTRADLRRMGDTYLVTHAKLLDLAAVGARRGIVGLLVVELADGSRYIWKISDSTGAVIVPLTRRLTTTQATSITKETTERWNAYLPFSAAQCLRPPQQERTDD